MQLDGANPNNNPGSLESMIGLIGKDIYGNNFT